MDNQVKAWEGFKTNKWQEEINVRDFINLNYTPYEGDDSFLAPATDRTNRMWKKVAELMKQERANNGLLDADTSVVSSITSHGAGYIDKDEEIADEEDDLDEDIEEVYEDEDDTLVEDEPLYTEDYLE